MSYRVEVSARANRDLVRVVGWLAERSPEAADQLSDRFEEGLARLETQPFSCGLAYENEAFDEELRHLLFSVSKKRKYRALFVVRGDEVVIIAIRAPGERPITPDDLK